MTRHRPTPPASPPATTPSAADTPRPRRPRPTRRPGGCTAPATTPTADAPAATVHHNGTAEPVAATWWLYLLECRNGSYYAGIAKDVARRYAAHLAGRGARYTRANPPLRLLASRAYPDRASASRAEWQLKQQPRQRKLAWLLGNDSHPNL